MESSLVHEYGAPLCWSSYWSEPCLVYLHPCSRLREVRRALNFLARLINRLCGPPLPRLASCWTRAPVVIIHCMAVGKIPPISVNVV